MARSVEAGLAPPDRHDVVVLGGGPSGSAAATLLARCGHSVVLVRPSLTPQGSLAEAVPPSARKLLAELGALDAVERAGFQPNLGNTVWWAGGSARSEPFPAGQGGFHVVRRAFEDVLIGVARAAGAHTLEATAREARESAAGWIVDCETTDGSARSLESQWIVDATGRRGVLARGEGRIQERDTATLALLGRWRRSGERTNDLDTHTLVESYASGWAWSVPLGDDVWCVSAMVDHRHEELQGASTADMLHAEIAKTAHLREWFAGAVPVADAWACPASLYHAERYARPGLVLVGDAASFIDPLSSFGVKKAISSGWLGAVAVNTALSDASMIATAIDFHDEREGEVFDRYRALSARYYREAAEAYGHPYWRARAHAGAGGDEARGSDPEGLDVPLVPEVAVRGAFDAIRARERLAARPGPGLRRLDRPAIQGHRIVSLAHLATDDHPTGVRFVRSVDLLRLVELSPQHAEVPELWAAYNGVATPVSLPDFLVGLSTAFAAGFLVHDDA